MIFFSPPYLSLLVSFLLSLPNVALAQNPIHFVYLKGVVQEKQLVLNAVVEFELPPPVILAIDHDIHIQFKTEIVLLEEQDMLGMTFKRERQSIAYHTELYAYGVNRYYVLYNHRNYKRRTFQTLEAALQTLGTLQAMPIVDLSELDAEKTYFLKIRLQLDKWRLPAPLLIDGLLEEYWRLNSGWQEVKVHIPKKVDIKR